MIPIKLNIQKFASTTIYLSVYTGSYNVTFQGRLDVNSVVDNTNNQSTVTVSLYARKQNSSSPTYGKDWSGNITIDGSSDAFNSLSSSLSIGNDWVLVRTYSKLVSHNTDGTKTIYISGSITGARGTGLANATSSGGDYFTLDTVPRYFSQTPYIYVASKTETQIVYNWSTSETCSAITFYGDGTKTITGLYSTSGTITVTGLNAGQYYSHYGDFTRSDSGLPSPSNSAGDTTFAYPSITSSPNFIIGNQLSIGVSSPRRLSCAVYLIVNGYERGGDTTDGTYPIVGYNGDDWQTWLYEHITSSESTQYKVKLVCNDLNRTTIVDGGIVSINKEVSKPIFSDFYFEDVNTTTLALTNDSSKIVDGYSTIKVTIPSSIKAQGYKNAQINYYNINGNNWTYAENFTTEPNNIPNYLLGYINVSAIDTRGNEKLITKSTTLLGYFKPTANLSKEYTYYERSNQGVGSQVTFNFKGTFWNNNFGVVTNTIKRATYQYKKTGASGYGQEIDIDTNLITINGNDYSFSGILSGDMQDNGFDIESSYNVIIKIYDELDSTQFNYTVIEGSPAIDLFGNCISLGGMYNENVGGRVQINNNGVVLYENANGSNTDIELSKSANNFNLLEIYFRSNDNVYNSIKVSSPNNKYFTMFNSYPFTSGNAYIKLCIALIQNNYIRPYSYSEVQLDNTTQVTVTSINNCYITKVVGYV